MGKSRANGDGMHRPTRPTPAQAKKFHPAIYGKHWAMCPNAIGSKTDGNGYACLIMDNLRCDIFTKHVTLVNHMLDYHELKARDAPRGRPKTSSRIRKPLTEKQSQQQSDGFLGSFPQRLWSLKKNQMLRILKWAHNAHCVAQPTDDKLKWIVNKAKQLYTTWRSSDPFGAAVKKIASTVTEYWDNHIVPLTQRQVQQKSRIPSEGEFQDDGRSGTMTAHHY